MILYVGFVIDAFSYLFTVALMLYCVDGAIKALKKHYKKKKEKA